MKYGQNLIKTGSFFIEEKKRIIAAFVMVFIWGLLAHAYGFLNLTISHDSVAEFFVSRGDIAHRISLGRFVVPVYQLVFHGRITLPWLNGILSLCWLSISVWLTACMFSIEDKVRMAFVAGIYTVNITVTATAATYIECLDVHLFAVMLSTAAAFLWFKGGKMTLLGIPLLIGALGCYQSMLSVAITLIMLSSIMALIQKVRATDVVRKGFIGVGMIFTAGIFYLALVALACHVSGVGLSNAYNGLTHLFEFKGGLKQYPVVLFDTYLSWIKYFRISCRPPKSVFLLHVLLAFPTVFAVIGVLCKKGLPIVNKLLFLMLGALLPLGMNISCAVDGGMVHDLMLYSANLIYLLAVLLVDWYIEEYGGERRLPYLCRIMTFVLLTVILAFDVQTANQAYVKKNLERQVTLSLMTNVNYDLNNTDGYIAGDTEVLFIRQVGIPDDTIFKYVSNITGLYDWATCSDYYDAYYKYFLQQPLKESSRTVDSCFIENMPSYPEKGYIAWYDDILVVKLSD